jgi:polyferredoxin
MRRNRRIIQAVLFIVFLIFLFSNVFPIDSNFPNPFSRLSPLSLILTGIAGKGAYPWLGGVLLLILTGVLGRFFCGYMCPMGTTIDGADALMKNPAGGKGEKKLSFLKYIVLAFLVFSAIAGLPSAGLLDPTTLAYRLYTFTLFPVADRLWRGVQAHFPSLAEMRLSHTPPFYLGGIGILLIFVVIFLLGRHHRRFWCRNLCPLGALLSIPARFSLLRKEVSDACIQCGKCTTGCKMGAIPNKPESFRAAECVYCFNCVALCPVKAINFKVEKSGQWEKAGKSLAAFLGGKPSPAPETSSGFTRRHFLEGAAAGVAMGAVARLDPRAAAPHERFLRPPGAMAETSFNQACIRCGECMKVCITGGLQPSLLEGGVQALMTPRLVPAMGHCEYQCDQCQKVCPTGAIQPFLTEDKPFIKMGSARIDRSSCIAWYRDEYCLVCDEHCPYKAIYWKLIDGRLRPMVDPDLCTGCGFCENRCPVKPDAAIRAYRQGEKRFDLKKGDRWKLLSPLPQESVSAKFQVKPPAQGGY